MMLNRTYLMQVPGQDFKFRSSRHFAVVVAADIGSVDCVTKGVFTTIRPIENFSVWIDFKVNRFRQFL